MCVCEGVWRTSGSQELPYLLPLGGQRLTLEHLFVADAQLLLLLRASLRSQHKPVKCEFSEMLNYQTCEVPTETAKCVSAPTTRHSTAQAGWWGGLVRSSLSLFTFLHAGTGASRTGSYMGIGGRGGGKRWSRLGRESPLVAK